LVVEGLGAALKRRKGDVKLKVITFPKDWVFLKRICKAEQ
jgi:hypothetical protein